VEWKSSQDDPGFPKRLARGGCRVAVRRSSSCLSRRHPAPERVSLERLKELDDPKLTPTQKAKLALRFYRDEMRSPTPRRRPSHAGDWRAYTEYRTHDYVLAQITRKLAACGADTAFLKEQWQGIEAGEVKDCLSLFLLLKGDPELKEPVQAYALDGQGLMRLRELAVEALAAHALKTDDDGMGKVFARIVREDGQTQYKAAEKPKGEGAPPLLLVYPVRRAAAEAIRQMEKRGMLLESHVLQAGKLATEAPLPGGGAPRAGLQSGDKKK